MKLLSNLAGLLIFTACFLPAAQAAEQPVKIQSGAYPVPGTLALPAGRTAPVPAVLLLHGTASQKDEVGELYRHLAMALEDAGIASLRIDFAGSGDSPVSYLEYSLTSATADALRALDYLRAVPTVDADAIIVLGFSQGGLIAQRVVLDDPDIAALATWSTVAQDGVGSFQEFFNAYYATAVVQGFANVSFAWLSEPLAFNLRWFEEIRAQDTLTRMLAFEKPILAIAGAADQTVAFTQSLALITQSPHPQSRALILANANHIFNVLDDAPDSGLPAGSRQLLEETVRWISGILYPATRGKAETAKAARSPGP